MKRRAKDYLHQSDVRSRIGKAVQLAAAMGYRYRDGRHGEIRRLLPFMSGHKCTLFVRTEVETFVADLFGGKIEFVKPPKSKNQ